RRRGGRLHELSAAGRRVASIADRSEPATRVSRARGEPALRAYAAAEAIIIPVPALLVAAAIFGAFIAAHGKSPVELNRLIYAGAFGTWFSWQNTLLSAAPLLLVALCVALPARLGLV